MRQTAIAPAKAVRKTPKSETPDRQASEPLMTKSEMPGNENHSTADFIVGALLYSLFASHRSEAVSALLPDGEEI